MKKMDDIKENVSTWINFQPPTSQKRNSTDVVREIGRRQVNRQVNREEEKERREENGIDRTERSVLKHFWHCYEQE